MKDSLYLVRLHGFKIKDRIIYNDNPEYIACIDNLIEKDILKICSENNFNDEDHLVVVRIKDNSVTEYVGAVLKDYINKEIKIEKLDTVQKLEKLNNVYAVDEIGNGGANHKYVIVPVEQKEERLIISYTPLLEVQMQCGARKEVGSQHGAIDSDLLEIVRDRLKSFQDGEFSSEYNQHALEHIEETLKWMNKRVEDRIARNVLGKNKK